MSKGKVAVGILAMSTLLAIGLVLYFSRPDDVERVFGEYGPITRNYAPGLDDHVTIYAQAAGDSAQKVVCEKLLRGGWKRTPSRSWVLFLTFPGQPDRQVTLFPPSSNHVLMQYDRPTTWTERLIRRASRFFRATK